MDSSGFMEAKCCVELEPAYSNTLAANKGKSYWGSKFLQNADLLNVDVLSDEFHSHISQLNFGEGLWAFVGGPPCQSFSSLGKMGILNDPRGNLSIKYVEYVCKYRPRFFVFENVPPVGQNPGKEMRSIIYDMLEKSGYHFCSSIVNMADYGCYTKRKRYIIIGDRDKEIAFPEAPYKNGGGLFHKKWKSSREALDGIPDPYLPNSLSNHDPVHHTDEVRQRFEALQPGEYDRKRHRSKLDPNLPGPTLVAGGNSGYVHHIHWDGRELTSRESASIHGFPLDYEFRGSKLDVAKQIVNSIPIEFGRFLAGFLSSQV